MIKTSKLLRKKVLPLMLAVCLLAAALTACAPAIASSTATTTVTSADGTLVTSSGTAAAADTSEFKYTEVDLDAAWSTDSSTAIVLQDSPVLITAAGTYVISGKLADGQIIVRAGDEDVVRIVLNGADISCTASAPISIETAKKVVLLLADGSENTLTYGTSASSFDNSSASDDPNAAIYSLADLTINGSGSLTVNAFAGHGIVSKDKLKIISGTLTVTSAGNGLKGRDCVAIQSGMITIDAGGKGIKSNNDEDTAKGFILIDGGTITVNSDDDTINAQTSYIQNGGTISLNSGDDGIHADATVTINGGSLTVSKSYEGIESAVITVNSGTVNLTASDDGFNVAGGNDSSSVNGRPGQGSFAAVSGCYLNINGGEIVVNSGGDGLDSNGSIVMTGGQVTVSGPTDNGNGAIDYNGTFQLTGGYLLAVGSSGMAEAPDSSSTQYAIQVNFTSALAANTTVQVKNAAGSVIAELQPAKTYQSITFSSADLKQGETVTVTAGTENVSLTLSSIITTSGATAGPGGKPGRR